MRLLGLAICCKLLFSVSCFLANSSVPATGTSFTNTSQQLFDLLMEEKTLRHQLEQKVLKNEAAIQKLSASCSKVLHAQHSAFTAWHPANGTTTHTLKFTTMVTGIGSAYSTTTGKFTCKIPGLYFFALSLYKKRTGTRVFDSIGCYIRKNGANLIRANLDPTDDNTDTGGFETSNFVTVNLALHDVVDVGGCNYNDAAYDTFSSFSGFLVHEM